jgi:osmotically-inducible protein OsmY
MLRKFCVVIPILALAIACSSNRTAGNNAPRDDKQAVEKSLDQAGYNNIRVAWDKDKRVIELNGRVRSNELKTKAGEVAQQAAPGNVIANQLSIEPVDQEHAAKTIESNVDDAIEKNFKAVLIANGLDKDHIRFNSKNGVLTLNGKVATMEERMKVQKVAASVPNVGEVVNKIDVDRKNTQQAADR